MEFNFNYPLNNSKVDLKSFEAFWKSSSTPKFGNKGSLGWKAFSEEMKKKAKSENSEEEDTHVDEDEVMNLTTDI